MSPASGTSFLLSIIVNDVGRDAPRPQARISAAARPAWPRPSPAPRSPARRSYWSLNIAMAVPPLATVTLLDLEAPDEGAQVTE